MGRAAARSGSRSAGGKRARCEPRLTQRGRAVGRSSPTPPSPPPHPSRSRSAAAVPRGPQEVPPARRAAHPISSAPPTLFMAAARRAPGPRPALPPAAEGRWAVARLYHQFSLLFVCLVGFFFFFPPPSSFWSPNSFFSLSLFPPLPPPQPELRNGRPRARPPPPPPAARSRSLSAANRRCARTCPRYGVSAAAPREGRKRGGAERGRAAPRGA